MTDSDSPSENEGYKVVDPPRDVRIERKTQNMYKELQNKENSPYEGAQLMEIFMNAAAVGSNQGLRQPLEGDKMALFNVGSLSDKQRTTIRSIAFKEAESKEVYYNHKQAFNIVMEFANGGIRQLYKTNLGIGDNTSELTTDLITRWQDIEEELEERGLLQSQEF